MSQLSQDQICRDERCPIIAIHELHDIRHMRFRSGPKSKSTRLPWKRPAPEILDEVIVETTSLYRPKRFQELYHDVQADYGEIAASEPASLRQVHWHLERLIHAGRVWRADLGDRLYAYLRPGSKVMRDFSFLRDLVFGGIPEAISLPHRHLGTFALTA